MILFFSLTNNKSELIKSIHDQIRKWESTFCSHNPYRNILNHNYCFCWFIRVCGVGGKFSKKILSDPNSQYSILSDFFCKFFQAPWYLKIFLFHYFDSIWCLLHQFFQLSMFITISSIHFHWNFSNIFRKFLLFTIKRYSVDITFSSKTFDFEEYWNQYRGYWFQFILK